MVLLLLSLFLTQAEAKQLRIAVIDTGLSIEDSRYKDKICGFKDLTGEGITDLDGHGTHVTSLIIKEAKDIDYCLVILKYFKNNTPGKATMQRSYQAFQEAYRQHVDVINYSGGGPEFDEDEQDMIASHPEVPLFAAAGNDGADTSGNHKYYPACYDLANIISIGALSYTGSRAPFSNFGACVKQWEYGDHVLGDSPGGGKAIMSGTSMATGIATGKWVFLHGCKNDGCPLRREK